ncbi:MAG TPA: hypothetical protein VIL20_21275 [Sandaracinaceae bacterium]
MRTRWLGAFVAFGIATGCTTGIALTDRGEQVRHVAPAEVPLDCRLLGDVTVGIPPDAGRPRTEEQLVMLMRNRAGALGATHVIIEQSEQRGEQWVGRGRAYTCPAAPPRTVSAATAGGEDEGGAEGEGDTREPAP